MVIQSVLEACKIGDLETLKNLTSANSSTSNNNNVNVLNVDSALTKDKLQALVDSNGAGCLHYAARGGSRDVMEYLIKERGLSALRRSNTGATALHDAAAKGNTAIVKWLIENTDLQVGDQDSSGATALHLAARFKHILTVEWLMDEAHASVAARAANDALPIHFAVVGGDINCVKILVDENPRLINMQMNNGTTPVYLASQAGQLDILKFLVSKNGATKIKAYDAMSCLHAAAQNGHLDVVKWLIKEEKCNPNDRDFDGATPLHYAASRGHADVVQWMLKEGGAKVTLDNLGGSPLHNAAELGEIKTVVALLRANCDVTLVDNEGLTAAELADKCGQKEAAAVIRGEISAEQALVRLSSNPSQVTNGSRVIRSSRGHSFRETDNAYPPTPPLPTPPQPFSPPSSLTTSSPISPPSPLSEAEDEITVLGSSAGGVLPNSHSGRQANVTRTTVNRTVSNISVDSTASNFGIFENQQGPIVHVVKADVHHTPKHIVSSHTDLNSSPGGNGVQSARQESLKSTHVTPVLPQRSGSSLENASLSRAASYSRPGPVHIYSRPGSVKVKSETPRSVAPSSPSTSSVQINGAPTKSSLNHSIAPITAASVHSTVAPINHSPVGQAQVSSQLAVSPPVKKKPYYNTPYRQDFNTVSKNKFAKVKAAFQQGATEYICPDSGEICIREDQHSRTEKQIHKEMDHNSLDGSAGNGLSGTILHGDETKQLVDAHGGHVTIISTGGVSHEKISVASATAIKHKEVPGAKTLSDTAKDHSTSSNNTPALLKDSKPPVQVNNGTANQTPKLSASNDVTDGRGQNGLSRPHSIHTSNDPVARGDVNKSNAFSRSTSQPHSPKDLIADIQSAISGTSNLSLRRAKSKGEGVSMVYQSRKSMSAPQEEVKDDHHRPLSGQFDPKNFLDQIEKVDSTGLVIPEWRRQVLAKHAAEKAQKEYEENKKAEDYEERFKNIPAWKRAIIEKKEAPARDEAASVKK